MTTREPEGPLDAAARAARTLPGLSAEVTAREPQLLEAMRPGRHRARTARDLGRIRRTPSDSACRGEGPQARRAVRRRRQSDPAVRDRTMVTGEGGRTRCSYD
ncbi:hypothetical protein [Streptomyces peucetius]|nr:hypothetical protein CGZ69_17650 [Streptomyces peucetius subsp. caesius ATCC 27952]